MRNSPKRLNHKRKKFDCRSPENQYRKRFPTENVNNSHGVVRCSPAHPPLLSQKPPLLPPPSDISMPTSSRSYSILSQTRLRTAMRSSRQSDQESPKIRPDGNEKADRYLMITSASPLGPDPSDLPREVLGIFRSVGLTEDWSGSAFSISPSPSSLPLPRFSLKHKGQCSSDATAGGSGIDSGATESLRRLLRIH